jgi:hypothetical protein
MPDTDQAWLAKTFVWHVSAAWRQSTVRTYKQSILEASVLLSRAASQPYLERLSYHIYSALGREMKRTWILTNPIGNEKYSVS